ncbi:MAG: IS1595 family transposase [Hyphomicrobiaceae bacterium]
MEKELTAKQLRKMFPDDDACLEHIMRIRYGSSHECSKCGRDAKYYRTKARRSYTCEHCGHQVYPTAGTPFHRSRTSLTDWFTVMHMFTTTRNGVAAKEIQRTLGVTYKTAWRMGHVIREYMAYIDGDAPLGGPGGRPVEIDKAFIGGKDKKGKDDKAVVLGMTERNGDVILRHVASRRSNDITPHMVEHVRVRSRVYTDEAHAFNELRWSSDYKHEAVNHKKKEWARGPVHTNTIEGIWSGLKRTVSGTHVWVSKKWLSSYLGEHEFRHNHRSQAHLMMRLMLTCFPPARRET